jgi:hypothetical protein
MLLGQFCDEEVLDDQTEDHKVLVWNNAVMFDTVKDFDQLTKYFNHILSDTDIDYTSDNRDYLFDCIDRACAFDNNYNLDMHEQDCD